MEDKLSDTYLVESITTMIKGNKTIVNHYVRSINEITYKDIVKNKDSEKYKHVVLVFKSPDEVMDFDLNKIITLEYGRWHVSGDPLDVYPNYADRHKRNLVQSWYSKSELLRLMCEKIVKKDYYVIYKKEK